MNPNVKWVDSPPALKIDDIDPFSVLGGPLFMPTLGDTAVVVEREKVSSAAVFAGSFLISAIMWGLVTGIVIYAVKEG